LRYAVEPATGKYVYADVPAGPAAPPGAAPKRRRLLSNVRLVARARDASLRVSMPAWAEAYMTGLDPRPELKRVETVESRQALARAFRQLEHEPAFRAWVLAWARTHVPNWQELAFHPRPPEAWGPARYTKFVKGSKEREEINYPAYADAPDRDPAFAALTLGQLAADPGALATLPERVRALLGEPPSRGSPADPEARLDPAFLLALPRAPGAPGWDTLERALLRDPSATAGFKANILVERAAAAAAAAAGGPPLPLQISS
jgi:hypothetical protein